MITIKRGTRTTRIGKHGYIFNRVTPIFPHGIFTDNPQSTFYFYLYLPLQKILEQIFAFRYPNSEDRIFNRVISDISIALRETTITISDSIKKGSPIET